MGEELGGNNKVFIHKLQNDESRSTSKRIRNPYLKEQKNDQPILDYQLQQEIKKPFAFSTQWMNDEKWIGEKIHKKAEGHTRLWLQNPNGITAKDDFRVFRSELDEVRENEIDFLALPESTLNSNNYFVRDRLSVLVEYHHPNSKMCLTSTKGYCKDACYQPGGSLALATNKLAGRYAGKGSDGLGRYSWMKFCGRLRAIKIYTFYRVSQESGNGIGDTTAYVQQYNLLNENYGKKGVHNNGDEQNETPLKIINPRTAILNSLLKDIRKDIEEKTLIILLGDLNENVLGAKFNEQLGDLGIKNAIQMHLGGEKFRTQNRGKHCIDGMWVSCTLLPHIQKMGIAPFSEIFDSDHRGMYMDLSLQHILDSPPIEFKQIQYRRLQLSIPKRTREYVKSVELKWVQHGLKTKIDNLTKTYKQMRKDDLKKALDGLDKQIGEILTCAEKRCTNVSKDAINEWSPKLGKLIKEERECKKRVRKIKRCFLDSNFSHLQEELKIERDSLIRIKKELKEVKKNDAEYRKAHIEELALEKLENHPNSTYAGELKKLQHIESQRKEARMIRNTKAIVKKKGITSVLIPDVTEYVNEEQRMNYRNMDVIWERLQKKNGKDVGKWIEIEERKEVERLTMQCMKKHFSQAQGTPLTTNVWSDRLVNDEFITQMQQENYEELCTESEAVQDYFKAMQQPNPVNQMEPLVYTYDDWKRHIKRVLERTTTSPAGRHYGHLKVLLEKAEDVFGNIYDIMNMALQTGILLDRWTITVTVLIPKDGGKPKLHRLRPLHIVEPEINAVAKAWWAKKLMKIATATNNMSDDQYGGRKNRQAQSAVLNKILYYDINRMQMKEAQYDDIDMKSNYDRELVRLVAAEARIKLGLHKKNANFMVDFVEQQKFHVKTAFGISENNYAYEETNKLYGLGQGIAWSGPGWLLSSDTVAKCKDKTCVGMVYNSPISNLQVKKKQDMFVDDMGCGCNQTKDTNTTIMQQAQINCQNHSQHVETTGGMIAADKSHFYHVKWMFVNGLPVPDTTQNENTSIELHQCDGYTRKFNKMDNWDEHKTLGCWVNPLGVQIQAYHQIEKFMKDWVQRMMHSNLPAKLIRKSYESELKSQIRYRLPLYMFTSEQCDELMKIVNPTLLHTNHVNKNYPRTLLQANEQYGGMNIQHVYDIMGMEKTKFMLMHLRRKDTTAKLLQIAMQNIQLECGASDLFFNLSYSKYVPLVTPTWCSNLWEYYDSRAIEVDMDLEIVPKYQRHNDQCIMDILVQSDELSNKELIGLNKYRQYLQVIMLSDIVDLRGRRILQEIKEGKNRRLSTFTFAPQKPLTKWENWWKKKACPILERSLQQNPLGRWIHETHQVWEWESTLDGMYLKHGDEMYKRGKYVYEKEANLEIIGEIEFTTVADVRMNRKEQPYVIAKEEKKYIHEVGSTENRVNPFSKYRELWGKVEMKVQRNELRKCVELNQCVLATDGSNKENEGAQAWIIATKEGRILARGRGRVNYSKDDASSLRPELGALIAATAFISDFATTEGIPIKHQLSIYTDSANAITDMESAMYPSTKNVLENNIDMKLELKHILRTSPFQFRLHHVRAHQDAKIAFDDLPFEAQLNCIVDEYASGTYSDEKCGKYNCEVRFLTAQVCSLKLPFTRPVSNIKEQLTSFMNGHASEAQLARFWKIRPEWMCNVEWDAFKTSVKRERGVKNGNMCKIAHKQLPTMKLMKRNGMSVTNMCPLCNNEVEDWDHVFRCRSMVARVERELQLQQLKQKLQRRCTAPILVKRILAVLRQWTNTYPIQIKDDNIAFSRINQAFLDQCNLGVSNLFAGVITYKFGMLQEQYYIDTQQKGSKFTRSEWNIWLVRALLTYSKAIWKNRCDFYHEKSNMNMEKQTRMLAIQLKITLKNQPWKLRLEDAFLLRRNQNFFSKSALRNIKGWVERIMISMRIAEENDINTRQDIKQWIILPANGYVKNISYPKPSVRKKYKQLKLWNNGERVTATDMRMVEAIELPNEMRENQVQENNGNKEIKNTYLQATKSKIVNAPIRTWYKRLLGTWKKQEPHVPNEMEEIVFVSNEGEIPICTPNANRFAEHNIRAGMEDGQSQYVGSDDSTDYQDSGESMIFESIEGSSLSICEFSSGSTVEENFEEYFKKKCRKKNQFIQGLLSRAETEVGANAKLPGRQIWSDESTNGYSMEGNYTSVVDPRRKRQSVVRELKVNRRRGQRNSQISKMLVEGSLYEGSSITSVRAHELNFFPEEEAEEEKEESELWNIQIENMEILKEHQDLKKLQSISIYGAVHPSSDATRKKSKRAEQNRESQLVRGYCEVKYSPDPQQDRKIKQHRDPNLEANSQLRADTLSFSSQALGNIQRQRHPIPRHDVIMNKKRYKHPENRKEDHNIGGTTSERTKTNGAGTIKQVWRSARNDSEQGEQSIEGVLHAQQSGNIKLKQQPEDDLSVNFEELNKVCILSEALTDPKKISRAKCQMDDGKISEALCATLIGRNEKKKVISMKLKKIGYDIRQYMTSKSKQKKSTSDKFFPIFRNKNNNVES